MSVQLRAAALAALGVVAPAAAFECAPLRPSAAQSPAYRPVAGQARCEGFFERTVSQPFVELLSLTRGDVPAQSGELEIRTDAAVAARLVVQPQRSRPFYRVDAELPGGQPLRWDPAPMLAATQLPLAELGFLGVTAPAAAGATDLAVLPLRFGSDPAGDGRRLQAVVRVSVEVSSVAWRSAPPGGPATPWTVLPDSHLYAWRRLVLPIELPAADAGLRVDVQAVAARDAQPLPMLRFEIVGAADGGRR